MISNCSKLIKRKRCRAPLFGRPRSRSVLSSPNLATVLDTHFSEPYGQVFFRLNRILGKCQFACRRGLTNLNPAK